MKLPDKITTLTPEVMDAYLEGRLNDRQRHQVEKLLLEDDFASEAMEGLDLLTAQEREESVQHLGSALSEKFTKKISRFPWMAVAAAVLLLFVAAIWLVQYTGTNETIPEIAQTEKKQEAPVRPPAEIEAADAVAPSEEIAEAGAMEMESEYVEENYNKAAASPPAQAKQAFQDTVGLVLRDVSPERLSQLDQVAMDTMGIDEALPTAANELEQPQTTVGRIAGEPIPKEVSSLVGTIILQDGMPLSNVNVLIDGTENAAFSDEKGKFNIAAKSDATLVFSMMGLESREISGEDLTSDGQVVMRQESVTLSELEVTTSATEQFTSQGAGPEMDEDAYEKYLRDNIVYPELDDPQAGDVVIRVTIEPDGTISNTKIVRSLGEPYDVEAIRLIREGPAWRPAVIKGIPVRDKVRVKVRFEENR